MDDAETAGASHTEPFVGAPVDEACDEFEACWQRGERPRIEEFLARVEPSRRASLLVELLALDVSYRRKNKGQPESTQLKCPVAVRLDAA